MIHPTAIVHPEADVHPEAEIGPWCSVGRNVKIGRGTRLVSHVVVDGWTELGEENRVFPFAVLGAIPQDLKYKGEATQLIVGNRNTIRESVTLNLGTVQGGGVTRMGDGNLLMAYAHMGHDCTVGNQTIIANSVMLAGHVTVEDFANVGGGVGVVQFVRIGTYAYVAGMSGVEKDVLPFSIAIGNRPCTLKGANIVGLRRRGISTDVIQRINEAIKLWARHDVPRDQALAEIESQYGELAEIQKLLQFIRSSDAGCAR